MRRVRVRGAEEPCAGRSTDGAAGQRKAASSPARPEAAAAAVARGGAPLPADLRSYFEPRFRHDLSRVRLHEDAAAGAAARSIAARAFTLGADIAFAPGEYRPGTAQGRRLLAHELAHVVQQASAPTAARLMRQPYPGCDRRTTGVNDPDVRIDDARPEAVWMAGLAHDAFPRMTPDTIRLADRHFHCPFELADRGDQGVLCQDQVDRSIAGAELLARERWFMPQRLHRLGLK